MNEINQGTLKIISNKMIDENHFILTFEAEDMKPKAGQFLMIDCISKKVREWSSKHLLQLEPMLKRPFSFYLSSTDGDLSILYKVKERGKGTGCLSRLKSDDEIAYLGPLGNPIDMNKICSKDKTVHLIAGGIGIAPITFLAQKLIGKGYKVKIYFGVKELNKFLDFCLINLNYIGLDQSNIMLSVEYPIVGFLSFDCNNNFKKTYKGINLFKGGMITILNAPWRFTIQEFKGPVFVCAPKPVMKYVHQMRQGLPQLGCGCYVFMEEHMGCGCGVCMSCDVNGKLVCTDGPCFNSMDVFKGEREYVKRKIY